MRTILTAILTAALPLLALGWSLDLFRAVGLYLFTEHILAGLLALALPTAFLTHTIKGQRRDPAASLPLHDAAAALLGFAAAFYIAVRYGAIFSTLAERPVAATIAGAIVLVLVVEALRRVTGLALTLVVVAFLVYALVGHLVPGDLQGRRVALDRLVVYLAFDSNGMLGMPMTVTATVVILYVMFGSFLTASGGGQFFTDLSMASMGRYRGGSAKIAVTASALFGSISGSAVANVASTGVVTIPMMKDSGFRGRIAGAVEAVASTGGQLMPPVMGAAAFLMAEMLQIGYEKVVIAALIPALIYFFAVFVQIDLIAARDGIAPVPADRIPLTRRVMRSGWYFLLPFAVLIGALFWWNAGPGRAAFWATLALLPLGLFLRYAGTGLRLMDLWHCLTETGRIVIDIVLISAAAGLIIGVLNITSLGFALTLTLTDLAGGFLIVLLVLAALLSIILGMGMPTVGVYILLATVLAPTLIELGVQPIAAHMFVMYFGMLSMITPPVAIAAFTAAVIAKAPPVATAVSAMRLGWTAMVVPFVFVYEPSILMSGPWLEIIFNALRLALGVWIVSGCLAGYLFRRLSPFARVTYGLLGIAAIFPSDLLPAPDFAIWVTLAAAASCVVFEWQMTRPRRASNESFETEQP